VKINAPTVLEKELKRRSEKNEYGFIVLSSATEPWMPVEEKYQVTRRCLRVILRYRFPIHCLTKSPLILRDIDLLRDLDKEAVLPSNLKQIEHGVIVTVSISTLREKDAKIFEPGAPSPRERLKLVESLAEEGVYTGVAYIPLLPFLSDSSEQLEEMVKTAKEYGANYLFVGALTLQGEARRDYYNVLRKRYPSLVEEYSKLYCQSYQPGRTYWRRIEKEFKEFCKKHKIKYKIT